MTYAKNLGSGSAQPLQLRQGDNTLALGAGAVLGADLGSLIDLSGLPAAGLLESAASGMVALAGGGQAGAPNITARLSVFGTVANDHDSSLLPPAKAGTLLAVANFGGHVLDVFPNGSDAINALGASTAFSMAASKTAIFFCPLAGQWYSLLTA